MNQNSYLTARGICKGLLAEVDDVETLSYLRQMMNNEKFTDNLMNELYNEKR